MTVGAVLKTKDKDQGIVAVAPAESVLRIADIISARRIGSVIVLDEAGRLVGIVSERDVVKALATRAAAVVSMRADELMTRDVVTATPETSVDEAVEIMDRGYFRHLPVLEDGRLVGIVSIRDLVKYRIMRHVHDVTSLTDYITRAA